jgi:Domain of unknown function (DUF4198)
LVREAAVDTAPAISPADARSAMPLFFRLCLLIFLLPSTAIAHPIWFDGEVVPLGERTQINLKLTTSHAFPKYEDALAPGRLQRAVIVSGDSAIPLLVNGSGADHLRLRAVLSDASAVWGVAQTKPLEIELDAKTVATYLSELGDPQSVRARYQQQKRWRELYSKNAKVWVQLDARPAPARMHEPLNLPFELVPQQDLAAIKVGATFSVCAFANGAPYPNAFVTLSNAAGKRSHVRADESGCASVKRPAGRFLLESIWIRASNEQTYDWRSEFASLTFIPAPSRPAAISATKKGTP